MWFWWDTVGQRAHIRNATPQTDHMATGTFRGWAVPEQLWNLDIEVNPRVVAASQLDLVFARNKQTGGEHEVTPTQL